MGKLTNLNPPAAIADSDIPGSITRDTEVTAVMNAHTSATHPHIQYPRFQRAVYKMNCPAAPNSFTNLQHGLDTNTIQGFTAFVEVYIVNAWVRIHPGGIAPWVMPNTFYSVDIGPGNINIRSGANSSNIYGAAATISIDFSIS
jgi:hypothetical protein